MQITYITILLAVSLCVANGFRASFAKTRQISLRSTMNDQTYLFGEEFDDEVQFEVGVDIPPEVAEHNCIYDMILVERFSAPSQTMGGLFLPKVEGKDQKHVGKVLSVPAGYGLESEGGRVEPIQEIAPYKVGDTIFIRDPWGIGPKQIEVGNRFFSFHKAAQIMGRIDPK